jgi:O-antigen biosynthesis protein
MHWLPRCSPVIIEGFATPGIRVLPESDLVPYQSVAGIPAQGVLVLAPHADDEVFGCGGGIAAHVRAGVPVKVVVLTDGAGHGEPSERAQESRAAAQVLGYGAPEFWDYPDRGLRCEDALVQRVVEAVAACGADLLYAPSPWEIHPDHRQAAAIAAEVVRRTGIRVAYYEVGAPLRPNLLLDITGSAETKSRAMRCFSSQLEQQDYERQIRALNEYRTYPLPHGVLAAEAYLVLSAADLDAGLVAALTVLPVSLGSSPSEAAGETPGPLVSVLIRSLDREHLHEALDSVALQTYPHIEVVVVAAKPGHESLPQRCGPFPLRLVPTDVALPRSRAANKALDEARGEYLLILDDDDWLMPGHIARLAHVLRRQPDSLAVYTGVAFAGPDGALLGQTLDLPFDGIRQLAGNLTPIHAVLFRKELLARGCRFDESLDRLEDWDFWLQVARQAPMIHVPGVSAAYRIHQSSGVHEDSGPMGAATQMVYQKWQASWSAGQGAALMQRAWSCADLEVELAAARESLAVLQELIAQQASAIKRMTQEAGSQSQVIAQQTELITQHTQVITQQALSIAHQTEAAEAAKRIAGDHEKRIADLLQSTSWRVTAPLRWLSSRLRPKA